MTDDTVKQYVSIKLNFRCLYMSQNAFAQTSEQVTRIFTAELLKDDFCVKAIVMNLLIKKKNIISVKVL